MEPRVATFVRGLAPGAPLRMITEKKLRTVVAESHKEQLQWAERNLPGFIAAHRQGASPEIEGSARVMDEGEPRAGHLHARRACATLHHGVADPAAPSLSPRSAAAPGGAVAPRRRLHHHGRRAAFLDLLAAFGAPGSSRSRFGSFERRVSKRLIGTLTACLPASYF